MAPWAWLHGSLARWARARSGGAWAADRVVASAVQLLAGVTALSLLALSLGDLDPARWSGVSRHPPGRRDSCSSSTRSSGSCSTHASWPARRRRWSVRMPTSPLVGAVMGATVLAEPRWAGAFVGA